MKVMRYYSLGRLLSNVARFSSYRERAWPKVLLMILLLATSATGLVALVGAEPAEAAFPGMNGKIVFTRGVEIYTIDPATGVKTNLTHNSVIDASPAFSANGSKIAFTSDRSGNYDVWVMNADGSNPTNLTSNSEAFDSDPTFSPDGSKIAFTSTRGGGRSIYVMNADGSSPTRLTTNLDGIDPAFSPDGTKIAFESFEDINSYEIYLMDPVDSDGDGNGDNQINLTDNSVNDADPNFSPDGTKIAFTSNQDGNHDIWVMDADGSDRVRLTTGVARDFNPAFSPDGTKIAFDRDTDGNNFAENYEIWAMNAADGSGQTNLTNDFPGFGVGDEDPDWGVKVTDTTPPAAPEITSPADNSYDADGDITLSGTAEASSTIEIFEVTTSGSTSVATTTIDSSGNWSETLDSQPEGSHTYRATAKDAADNTSVFSNPLTVIVDTTEPKVLSTTPLNRARGVARRTSVTATFSEKMDSTTLTGSTFKLFKVNPDGTTKRITNAPVTPSEDGLNAILDPFGTSSDTRLAKNTRYKAVVTIGATDMAGNALDQNAATSGNQNKVWYFTTAG